MLYRAANKMGVEVGVVVDGIFTLLNSVPVVSCVMGALLLENIHLTLWRQSLIYKILVYIHKRTEPCKNNTK